MSQRAEVPVFQHDARGLRVTTAASILVAAVMTLATVNPARAATGTWFMSTGGFSHHFQQTQAPGREWRETHPGLGFEHRSRDDESKWQLRSSGGLMQDSRGFMGSYAGAAYLREQHWGASVDSAIGIGAYAMYRSVSWSGKRTLVPALMPTASLSLADGRIGLNFVYMPRLKALNEAMPSVLYAQMLFKIR